MRSLSRVWKNPPISPHVALVAAPAMTERETKLSSEEDEVDTKEQLCERCRQELAEIMEANMLATAKLRIAELERAARKRSTDIINHARKQAAKLKEEAQDQGRQEGYQAGYNAAQEEAQQLIKEAKALVVEAQEEKNRLLAQVEPQALQLAFALAERILHREVTRSPEAVAELLTAAADKLPEGEAVVLEVAPGEGSKWTKKQNLLQEAMPDRPFQVMESANVPPGEFMLSSKVGTVDARLQSQLEVCRTHLLGEDVYAVPETGS